jgi:hypothetical protein
MTASGILFLFACIVISASLIIAVLFRFWPRYGSVEAAIAHSDALLDQIEHTTSAH